MVCFHFLAVEVSVDHAETPETDADNKDNYDPHLVSIFTLYDIMYVRFCSIHGGFYSMYILLHIINCFLRCFM